MILYQQFSEVLGSSASKTDSTNHKRKITSDDTIKRENQTHRSNSLINFTTLSQHLSSAMTNTSNSVRVINGE